MTVAFKSTLNHFLKNQSQKRTPLQTELDWIRYFVGTTYSYMKITSIILALAEIIFKGLSMLNRFRHANIEQRRITGEDQRCKKVAVSLLTNNTKNEPDNKRNIIKLLFTNFQSPFYLIGATLRAYGLFHSGRPSPQIYINKRSILRICVTHEKQPAHY